MRLKTGWQRYVVAAAAIFCLAASAGATTITPGQSGVSPTNFGPISKTLPFLAQVSGSFNIAGGAITGQYNEGVAVDPFGVTCSGCLDFMVVVSVDPTSTGSITRVGLDGLFPSFSDNVGYGIPSGGGIAPTSANFGVGLPAAPISEFFTLNPGQNSDVMVIATDATAYGPNGNLGFTYNVGGSSVLTP